MYSLIFSSDNPYPTLPGDDLTKFKMEADRWLSILSSTHGAVPPRERVTVLRDRLSDVLRDIFTGVAAATLVPLFVRLTRSYLLSEAAKNDVISVAVLISCAVLAGMLGSEFLLVMF